MTNESKLNALKAVEIAPQERGAISTNVTVTFINVDISLSLQDILEYQRSVNGLGMEEFRTCDMITYVVVYKSYSRDELVDYQLDKLYSNATSKYVHDAVEDSRDEDGAVVPGLVGNVSTTFQSSDVDGSLSVSNVSHNDSLTDTTAINAR